MKTFCIFIIRLVCCFLFECITYYMSDAQSSIVLTNNARIVLLSKARITCPSVSLHGNTLITVKDSASMNITSSKLDAIKGYDSISRFFILEGSGMLQRKTDSLRSYTFPIGYSGSYRGFTLDMRSLGTSGPQSISVRLIPNISGSINYEKYFPSGNDCVSNSWVAFNCLSSDGWHCDGPSDYEYTVSAVVPDYCGGIMHRIIKTSTGSNNWQDSIESVIGNLGQNFCQYSNWSGGRYKDFSDFAIASSASLLPVTLVDLQADALNQKCIRVSWKTEMELNNDKFLVGRGTDGRAFTIIGEVSGSGTTTIPQNYFFDDCTALPNVLYYYQLEQVDYDGASHWSPIVSARINGEEVLETKIFNILGQEISEGTSGIQMVQVRTQSGITCSKIFKPLP